MIRRLFTLGRKPPTAPTEEPDIPGELLASSIEPRRTVVFDDGKVVEITAKRKDWVVAASRAIADGVDMYPIVRRVASTYDKRHEARIKQNRGRDCGSAKCLVCEARGVIHRMAMTGPLPDHLIRPPKQAR